MKVCPECSNKFKQRKRGKCPRCGTPVYYSSDGVRRESDKEDVNKLLEMLENKIKERDSVNVNLKMSPKDMKFAMKMLDWARDFQNRQEIKFDAVAFLYGVVDRILSDAYWGNIAKDFFTVYNQREEYGAMVHKEMLQEHIKNQSDRRKLDDYQPMELTY